MLSLLLPVAETFLLGNHFLGSLYVSSVNCLPQEGTVTCEDVPKWPDHPRALPGFLAYPGPEVETENLHVR